MDFLAPEGVPSYILKIPPETPCINVRAPLYCTVLRSMNTTFSKNESMTKHRLFYQHYSVCKHRLSRYSSCRRYINEPCRSICARASFHALSTASNSLICSILQTHLSSSIRRPAKLLQVCRRIMVPRHGRHRNHSVHTTLQASFFPNVSPLLLPLQDT